MSAFGERSFGLPVNLRSFGNELPRKDSHSFTFDHPCSFTMLWIARITGTSDSLGLYPFLFIALKYCCSEGYTQRSTPFG